MGTTVDKGTYLNTTKSLLKDKINNLGGTIDDNTTFREYANQLQDIYDNLPKTEYQEGTEVNLGKTIKGKLDYENGVVGIGQAKQDSTQGYNLLNLKDGTYTGSGITVVVVNGKATISGTSTSLVTVPIDLNNSLLLTNNQVYSLYANNESINADVAFRPIAGDGAFQTSFSSLNNASAVTFTGSTTSITKVHIRVASGATVNNIICRPMVVVGNDTTKSYEQYTGGQASPNPSYPQEIKYVRGENKYNKNTATLGTISQTDGKTISSSGDVKYTPEYTEVNPNEQWTFSNANTSAIALRVFFYDESKNYISTSVISGQPTGNSFRTLSNARYIRYQFNVSVDNNLQLEEGTTSTPYLPYNTIEEVVSGKNKFNLGTSTYEKSGITGTYNGSKMKANGTTTASTNVFDPNAKSIGTFKAGNYVLSSDYTGSVNLNGHAHLMYLRSSNNLSSSDNILTQFSPSVTNSSKQFTLTEDTELFMQWYANSSGIAYDNLEVSIQIEQGSTATTYEPYITPKTYQLSLGDIELCAIGNYKDELIYDVENDRVYKNEKIKEVVFTGSSSENWIFAQVAGGTLNAFSIQISDIEINNVLLANYYKGVLVSDRANNTIYSKNVSNTKYIDIINNSISSVNDFKTWLSTHNTEVRYVKAQATEIPITNTTLINQVKALYNAQSINGTTIITSNGDLPLVIKVRGLKGE